jgi:protein-S-isoprenylcysteine O-methyltransferase Ste14
MERLLNMLDRTTAIRFIALYAPVASAVLLAMLHPRRPKVFAAGLVGILWVVPWLLALQVFNLRAGWWQFHAQGGLLRGMPVDLWLGWSVLWGLLPALAFRRTGIQWVVALFFALDLAAMPACRPVVDLSSTWLIGELVGLCLVLVPSLLLARWTLEDRRLPGRAALYVPMSGAVFLFLIPEIVFALLPGAGWGVLFSTPGWLANLELQGVLLLSVLGMSAVQEFARRGGGTPIPYDPPKRLVTSGFYRYVANPMQLSCSLAMLAWGGVLRNAWVAAAGVMSLLYSGGLADWDEGEDLALRFGDRWRRYRQHVRPWRLRRKPWHDPELPAARLYIAATCGACSEVRGWFELHSLTALAIVAAEEHPSGGLRRITYDPMDGTASEEGVAAFARGLEHIHLGWAFAGACLRLPGIRHFVQMVLDAGGLGPRVIPRRASHEGACKAP